VSCNIQFFSEGITFSLKNKAKTRKWICRVISAEKKEAWYINFIFCTDEYLADLNRSYLKRSTLTDVIAFNFSEEPGIISGDIYISTERVRENAKIYFQRFEKELYRVMIHGILHLTGYTDKLKTEKEKMTILEDKYLSFSEL
jgi:probable rRNA maturation factor